MSKFTTKALLCTATIFVADPPAPLHAEGTYTEIASYSCYYGDCRPGLPTSFLEVTPGTFFGGTTTASLFTLTPSGNFTITYTLPDVSYPGASAPFHASDGFLYLPAYTGVVASVFKYDLQQPPQQFFPPIYYNSLPLVETPDQILYGALVPVLGSGKLYTLTFAGVCEAVATYPQQLSLQTLLLASDGRLYGLTAPFVDRNFSNLVRIGSGPAPFRILATFQRANPSLTEASDGNFYGCGESNLFRLSPSGDYTNIFTFLAGSLAYGCGIQASDGNLYGTTYAGGAFGFGSIFRSTLGGLVTTLYSFPGTDGQQHSSQFMGNLVQGGDGKLYGQTSGPYIGSPGENVGATTYSFDLGLPKPLPQMTRATPASGSPRTSILITGKNFLGTTAVTLNGLPASFAVKAAAYLQFTVPAGAASGNVSITTPNGTGVSSFVVMVP